ncbi:MAG: hypothetical protein EAY75_16620 [Bacteroidetes bacterium]|nr:MAG: hypothetical protein EAY75_16620 [Bacteroidota bacterium]
MKKIIIASLWMFCLANASLLLGCASARGKKRGCVSSSASMGAERVLAGEKPEKKSKFKIKGMN